MLALLYQLDVSDSAIRAAFEHRQETAIASALADEILLREGRREKTRVAYGQAQFARRAEAAFCGLAHGDLNGGPTALARCLAGALLVHDGFDQSSVRCRYVRWWKREGADAGPRTSMVLEALALGACPSKAVHSSSTPVVGCWPLHRCLPLALCAGLADHELEGCALLEAQITHGNPGAGAVAAAFVQFARGTLLHGRWESPALVLPVTDGAGGVLRRALSLVDLAETYAEAMQAARSEDDSGNFLAPVVGMLAALRWPEECLDHASWQELRQLARCLAGVESVDAVSSLQVNDF